MRSKTDNSDLRAKLELRRHFLRKYHSDDPPQVLDCCQGSGLLWNQLRQEFPIAGYWGLDLKKRKGRLRLNSVRVLQQAGWPQNVVDIDTYGAPWKHWMALLPHVERAVTVFLTIGQWQMGTDRLILDAVGASRLRLSPGIACKLHRLATSYLLTMAYDYGIRLREAVEAVSTGHARYLGVRLEPSGNGATVDCSGAEPTDERLADEKAQAPHVETY
jgi:hypothetical protein